ncbi:MAG: carboxypeptidase regulatory-like domain-containing protein [Acidobacteria bacterium]|nr:carboxypeptidase regulatory-like domain-containing protein [Acidobacteriota bacterium]
MPHHRILLLILLGCWTPFVAADGNLLVNGGLESGNGSQPDGWAPFTPGGGAAVFTWDPSARSAGVRSVRIDNPSPNPAMWQQVVTVEAGRVYTLSGDAAFREVAAPGRCGLQLVFRDAADAILRFVNYPTHTGTREFSPDFPSPLKVRAPGGAAKVEVNLLLCGPGTAWFDEVFFGATPTGTLAGTVTSGGAPLAGARVRIWGDPWGLACEAVSDSEGRYTLPDVPVTFPRYVVLAGKNGYRTAVAGRVETVAGAQTRLDFDLARGVDPEDLRVTFGSLLHATGIEPVAVPTDAVIPASPAGYPEAVRCYLQADDCIRSDDPDVAALAGQLLAALPEGDRTSTHAVAWAVYAWVCRNIDHDGVFSVPPQGLDQPFRDVTSGIWQTISGEGWCWGRSFYDWAYKPGELLRQRCGICVEHAWLTSALLRALNIPARASSGSLEFYAQANTAGGTWVPMSTTAGRTSFRERGELGAGFGGTAPESRFSVGSFPVLHEDWDATVPGLWRETHPWGAVYEGSATGLAGARVDLATLAATGTAPAAPQGPPGSACYQVHYSDVTLNLNTWGTRRRLDVRFPLATESAHFAFTGDTGYWTNHPECLVRTGVETVENPPTEGVQHWFHLEFDLGPILNLTGDLDRDGRVTAADLVILRQALAGNVLAGQAPFTAPAGVADLDGSQSLDAADAVGLAELLCR